MPSGRPVSEETRAEVLRLHGVGLARNEIVRRVGVAAGTVTRLVRESGGSFDRAATAAAVGARRVDLAAERAVINEQLLRRAREFLELMDQPHEVFSFGGRENGFSSRVLPRPPASAVRDMMTSVGIAVQRSNELTRVDSDAGVGVAVGLLEGLAEAFGAAAGVLSAPDGDSV